MNFDKHELKTSLSCGLASGGSIAQRVMTTRCWLLCWERGWKGGKENCPEEYHNLLQEFEII